MISKFNCFRPMGDIIASSQLLPNKHDIIFFERNGLRHKEFSIRDNADILDISWNLGSDILSLILFLKDTKVQVFILLVHN